MAQAQTALIHALAASAGALPVIMSEHLSLWSSATFVGARHRLTLRMPHGAARRLEAAACAEAVQPAGHLIVELAVRWRGTLVDVTATTVEQA